MFNRKNINSGKVKMSEGFFYKVKKILFIIFVLISISFVYFVLSNFSDKIKFNIKLAVKNVGVATAKVISKQIGKPIPTDQAGHINVLILGVGGENWPGGWLTDTIMLASYNPNLGAVTFLSIPRDFYIEDKINNYKGKINGLFASVYLRYKNKIGEKAAKDAAAKALAKKVEEITGVPINKYALITFKGFVDFINSIGGVDVCVPQEIVDTKYPTYDGGWTTIRFKKGCYTINGWDALVYVRTRHSTSDFSRAQRQQQVIKSIIKKLFSQGVNIPKLKQYYSQYQKMVFTNIELKEILWLAGFIDHLKYFFSFVYTADCIWTSWKTVQPGCVLYFPKRDLFNGLSVILPIGATVNNPDWYEYTRKFANIVVYHQKMLIENIPIKILNGVDRKLLRKKFGYLKPIASDLAKKLKVYAFNIVGVGNYDKTYSGSAIMLVNGTGFNGTKNSLQLFLNIDKIEYSLTGQDAKLILGNKYIDFLK